jgi:hypothetical protein
MIFFSSTILIIALGAPITYALDFHTHPEIGSCADVECPSEKDGGCRVTNRTYDQIGLTTFPSAIAPNGENLTWTLGTHTYHAQDKQPLIVEKGFYLGTPPDLHLTQSDGQTTPFQGCAIFLQTLESTQPASNRSWTCEDDWQLGSECRGKLLDAARSWVQQKSLNGTSMDDYCQEMLENADFRPATCSRVLDRNGTWTSMRAIRKCSHRFLRGRILTNGRTRIALTGPTAPSPPTESQNASSICHPTLPKSNDLTFVYAYNDTGNTYSGSTVDMELSLNVAMTVFWSPDGEVEGALSEPEAQMSCLWPVNEIGSSKVENGVKGSVVVDWTIGFVGLVAVFLVVV